MQVIANTDLRSENIPSADSEMLAIFEFAQSFDGYEHWGAEVCGQIANDRRHGTLTEIRTCLFFEHRRYRHMEEAPGKRDERYIRSLVRKIHTLVGKGETN